MANPWFKFYPADYLKEVKFKGADANKRSCFLTLLCYAADRGGRVDTRYLTEDVLRMESGVPMGGEAWASTQGFYQWLVDREIGAMEGDDFVFKTWESRQESYLSGAERVKKHRSNKGDVTGVTLEEKRVEKNRREEKPTASLNFLRNPPPELLKEMSEKYECSTGQARKKCEDLVNYCAAKGKTYKDYRAFLENALSKDFGHRVKLQPKPVEESKPLSAEEQARVAEIKAQINQKMKAPLA